MSVKQAGVPSGAELDVDTTSKSPRVILYTAQGQQVVPVPTTGQVVAWNSHSSDPPNAPGSIQSFGTNQTAQPLFQFLLTNPSPDFWMRINRFTINTTYVFVGVAGGSQATLQKYILSKWWFRNGFSVAGGNPFNTFSQPRGISKRQSQDGYRWLFSDYTAVSQGQMNVQPDPLSGAAVAPNGADILICPMGRIEQATTKVYVSQYDPPFRPITWLAPGEVLTLRLSVSTPNVATSQDTACGTIEVDAIPASQVNSTSLWGDDQNMPSHGTPGS